MRSAQLFPSLSWRASAAARRLGLLYLAGAPHDVEACLIWQVRGATAEDVRQLSQTINERISELAPDKAGEWLRIFRSHDGNAGATRRGHLPSMG